MKHFLKLFFINLLIIIFLTIMFDYIYFKIIFFKYKQDCIAQNIPVGLNIDYKTFNIIGPDNNKTTNVYKYFLEKQHYNTPISPDNMREEGKNKAPIILFGDSYTWMFPDKGFQKLLSDYTGRTVFNFAFWGWGAQHTYYLINNPLLYKIINDNTDIVPEYAVYTYIRDHRNRLFPVMDYYLDIEPYLTYVKKDDKLVIVKYNFFHKLLFRLFAFRYLSKKAYNKSDAQRYDELYDLVSSSYFEIKKHYPDIKYIVFEYYQEKYKIEEEEEFFERLKKIGINVISSKELTKEDLSEPRYTIEDRYHPNIKAWQVLAKPLAKRIESI